MQKKEWLYQKTAQRLEQHLAAKQIIDLPPLQELAKQFGVGESTMGKAIRELARRGVIHCTQGRKARVATIENDKTEQILHLSKNGKNLLQLLRQEILDGKRKTGQPLPKIDYLAAKLHISRRAITQVLLQLTREQLIHKEGKKWIAGPTGKERNPFIDSNLMLNQDAPVVLILSQKYSRWHQTFQCYRQNIFAISLCSEFDRHNIRMIACGMLAEEDSPLTPSGIESIRRLIQTLGNRYLGTIIVCGAFPSLLLPQPSQWLDLFAKSGKPLVWCDLDDKKTQLHRDDRPHGLRFFSIQHNDRLSITTALECLATNGHTKIGVPYLAPGKETGHWSLDRMTLLKDTAAKQYPHIQLKPIEMTGTFWQEGSYHAIPDVAIPNLLVEKFKSDIQKLFNESDSAVFTTTNSLNRKLLAAAPFLSKLINDENVTAIIAPNDYFAAHIHIWLTLLNVSIPKDMSIVSFDNSTFFRAYPLATVDRGYVHMAYCTAHAIIGDIPVHTDKSGVVEIKSFLVNRGSLTTPRRRKISL